jgi:hypothetical protein
MGAGLLKALSPLYAIISGAMGGGGGKKKKKSPPSTPGQPQEFKRGGKVRKTGKAKVHKGERVLTAKQTKRYDAEKVGHKRRGRRRASKRR